MTPEDHKCFACGHNVSLSDSKSGICTNPDCEGLGLFSICGFCKEISFAYHASRMFCYNTECRMHRIERQICPTCNKASMISYKEEHVCINRGCASNHDNVAQCFFCGNVSFLSAPEISFCTKGDCRMLLRQAKKCYFCEETSFDVENSRCENPDCPQFEVVVTRCAECGETAYGAKLEIPKCLNGECPSLKKGADFNVGATLEIPIGPTKTSVQTSPADEKPELLGPEPHPPTQQEIPDSIHEQQTLEHHTPAPEIREEPEPEPEPFLPDTGVHEKRTEEIEAFEYKDSPGTDSGVENGLDEDKLYQAVEEQRAMHGSGVEDGSGSAADTPPPARQYEAPVASIAMGATPMPGESPLVKVFNFLRDHLFVDEEGQHLPVYLIIGLSGAGKTTYLTLLGDILENKNLKYYFPYDGIDVRRVDFEDLLERKWLDKSSKEAFRKRMRERAKDLIYDFAGHHYVNYIGKQQWPMATPPERGVDVVSSYFLVSDIRRDFRTIARVVTFETAGEEYEEIIRSIHMSSGADGPEEPLHAVIRELMDTAEGFIILIDPASKQSDNIFKNLFQTLRHHLEPRVFNHLCRDVRRELDLDLDRVKMIEQAEVILDKQKRFAERREKVKKETEEFNALIADARHKLKTQGLDYITSQKEGFLGELERTLRKLFPQATQKAREFVQSRGENPKILIEFFMEMVKFAATARYRVSEVQPWIDGPEWYKNDPVLPVARIIVEYRHDEAIRREREAEVRSEERVADVFKRVLRKAGVSPGFRVDARLSLNDDRTVRRFHRLKYLALCVTKSDMYHITYPPEKYPALKLPGSKNYLDLIEDYLRILGGGVRYYNTSAVGYSVLRDTRYYPGNEHALTPVNIVEPLFDMLHIDPISNAIPAEREDPEKRP